MGPRVPDDCPLGWAETSLARGIEARPTGRGPRRSMGRASRDTASDPSDRDAHPGLLPDGGHAPRLQRGRHAIGVDGPLPGQFVAEDGEALGRLDPETHLVAIDLDDRDPDV